MRSSLLLLSQNAGTTTHVRGVLEHALPGAVLDVCSSPVQLRHRLGQDPSCLAVAIDEVTIGNALIPFVRHLRSERPGICLVLVTETPGDETTARGVFAGVDLVSARDADGAAELVRLLTVRTDQPTDRTDEPLRVLAWNVSRQMLTAIGRSQRLSVTSATAEQILADSQAWQSLDAILLAATPPEEAALLLHRLRVRAGTVPMIVLCDDQSRNGFVRLGAADCLTQGCGVDQIESAIGRAVELARLGSEAVLLRSKEQRLRSLVESLPEGVLVADPDGIVQAINREAVDLCRAESSASVLGRPLTALFGAANDETIRTAVAEVIDGRRVEIGIITQHEDARRHLELRAVPFTRTGDDRPFILLAVSLWHEAMPSLGESPSDEAASDAPPFDAPPSADSPFAELRSDEPSANEPLADQRMTALVDELERERVERSRAEQTAHEIAAELAAAQGQLAELSVVRGERDADREAHTHALAALERTCDELREQHRASDERAAALADAGDGWRSDNEALQKRIAEFEQERSAIEDERRTLRLDGEALRQRIARLERERSATAEELHSLRGRVADQESLRRARDEERAEQERLAGELEGARATIDEAHGEAGVLRDRLQVSEHEHRTALALADARAQALDAASRQLALLNDSQATAREEVANLLIAQAEAATALAELDAALAQKTAELEMALQELEPLRSAHAAACSAYISGKRSQSTLEHEIAALRAQLEESRTALTQAVAETDRAQQSRDDWERRAEAALERRSADDARVQQRADALMQGRAPADLEWLLGVATVGLMTMRVDGRIEHCNEAAARVCGWTDATAALAHGRLPEALLALGDPTRDGQSLRRFDTWIEGIDGTPRRVLGVAAVRPHVDGGPRIAWRLVEPGRQAGNGPTCSLSDADALPHLLTAATSECTTLVAQVERTIERLVPGDSHHLTTVQRGLMRARLVLKQLGSAAHGGHRAPAIVDVAEVLTQAATLVTRLAGDEVVADIAAPEDRLLVVADRTEIERLITALVLSGRECLPRGGRLALSAGSRVADVTHGGETVSRPSVVIRASASGYGAQPVVWQQASELAGHLGGRVETRHEASGGSTIEVVLPRALRLREALTHTDGDVACQSRVESFVILDS